MGHLANRPLSKALLFIYSNQAEGTIPEAGLSDFLGQESGGRGVQRFFLSLIS